MSIDRVIKDIEHSSRTSELDLEAIIQQLGGDWVAVDKMLDVHKYDQTGLDHTIMTYVFALITRKLEDRE